MASKFMHIKKIVIPLMTVVLLVSQLSGCAMLNGNELVAALESGQTITLEIAEPTTYEIASVVGSQQQSINWIQLDRLTTFPDFRIAFDKLINVERRTFNGTNTKIGCIFIDSAGDTNGNTSLQDGLRNKVFMEKYYANGDTKTALKQLSTKVYTDVNGEDNNSFLASFNAYYNLLPDNINPNAFNATQSVTRERFASALYKSTNPVSEDYLLGFSGTEDEFTKQMGALTDHTAMTKQLDSYMFINAADKSLDHTNIGGSISRAEAIYMVVASQFPDQLAEVTGKEKVSYSDAKNAGDLALKLGFKTKNKETKEIVSAERWQLGVLDFMLKHPDKGLQNDLYKVLVVADKYSLLDVTDTGECRWDEPLSKVEALQLLINIGSAKNNIYGFATNKAIGKANDALYGKVTLDDNTTEPPQTTGNGGSGKGDTSNFDGTINGAKPSTEIAVEGWTQLDQNLYEALVESGLTPDEAIGLVDGALERPSSSGSDTGSSGGTTGKPTTPNKPAGGNGGSKPSGGNVWDEAGMTEEEYHQWMKDTFGDGYNQGLSPDQNTNPEDLEGIS